MGSASDGCEDACRRQLSDGNLAILLRFSFWVVAFWQPGFAKPLGFAFLEVFLLLNDLKQNFINRNGTVDFTLHWEHRSLVRRIRQAIRITYFFRFVLLKLRLKLRIKTIFHPTGTVRFGSLQECVLASQIHSIPSGAAVERPKKLPYRFETRSWRSHSGTPDLPSC